MKKKLAIVFTTALATALFALPVCASENVPCVPLYVDEYVYLEPEEGDDGMVALAMEEIPSVESITNESDAGKRLNTLANTADYKEGVKWTLNTYKLNGLTKVAYDASKPTADGDKIRVDFVYCMSDKVFGALPVTFKSYSYGALKVGDLIVQTSDEGTAVGAAAYLVLAKDSEKIICATTETKSTDEVITWKKTIKKADLDAYATDPATKCSIITRYSNNVIADVNAENIPDENLRYIIKKDICNGEDVITEEMVKATTELNLDNKNIKDAKGIEYFTELTTLDLSSNKLDKIDVSALKKLSKLNLSSNELTALDVSKNTALEELNVSNNHIMYMSVDANTSLAGAKFDGKNQTKTVSQSTIDTSSMEGFNIERVSNMDNLKKDGKKLVFKDAKKGASYLYLAGNDCFVQVILKCNEVKSTLPFGDVAADSWYYSSVKYVYDNKLMQGTTEKTFEPAAVCTREMFVTILYNANGKPDVAVNTPFVDVKTDKWYSKPVAWAYANKVTSGIADNEFGIGRKVTRAQAANFLMNYAKFKGYDAASRADISTYADAATVPSWATDAMQWANYHQIIKGTNENKLEPNKEATRAEIATMIMGFQQTFVK